MPIYDYRCSECGRVVEVIHAIGAEGPSACEVCGGAMRKALSSPAIHFKGSGWAKKDAQSASRKSTTAGKAADAAEGGVGGTSSSGDEASAAGGSGKESSAGATTASGETKASPARATPGSGTD